MSARGSINFPKSVIKFLFLAIFPSIASVMLPMMKMQADVMSIQLKSVVGIFGAKEDDSGIKFKEYTVTIRIAKNNLVKDILFGVFISTSIK